MPDGPGAQSREGSAGAFRLRMAEHCRPDRRSGRPMGCAFARRLAETPYSAAHPHFVAERLRVPTAHGHAHAPACWRTAAEAAAPGAWEGAIPRAEPAFCTGAAPRADGSAASTAQPQRGCVPEPKVAPRHEGLPSIVAFLRPADGGGSRRPAATRPAPTRPRARPSRWQRRSCRPRPPTAPCCRNRRFHGTARWCCRS